MWTKIKAAFWAVIVAFGAGLLFWLRMDAKRDEKRDAQAKDYEHAEKVLRVLLPVTALILSGRVAV